MSEGALRYGLRNLPKLRQLNVVGPFSETYDFDHRYFYNGYGGRVRVS